MPAKTKIEWADYISNPIKAVDSKTGKRGHACVKFSEGCTHCWASGFNIRLGTGLGYTLPNLEKVEVFLDEKEIKKMWAFKPKNGQFKNGRSRAVVFPCDMTDIFGDWVSDDMADDLFQAMVNNDNVDWLVLTKRTDRMLAYLRKRRDNNSSFSSVGHIYIGCSVENQKRANERLDAMKSVSYIGWNTWVSFEPALEVVNWKGWNFLDGIICGGESGVMARPMPPEAAREARNFCEEHGIPYFFKQWGEWLPLDHLAWINDETTFKHKPMEVNGTMMVRVGRGMAGRVLDGMVHNISPIVPYYP